VSGNGGRKEAGEDDGGQEGTEPFAATPKYEQGNDGEGGPSDGSAQEQLEGSGGQAAGFSDDPDAPVRFPPQTPLFHAQHSDRYARQDLIRAYERRFGCRLIVMVDVIFPESVTFFEELLEGADPDEDLHLLLDSPGGDGETAVRLVRSAQARCRELTVIVPNQAKSAGTILLIGAHHILMGPTSDLGPVDPQFPDRERGGLFSAKDLIAAVDSAERAIAENPESYPLHVSLLADVTAVMVQQARSALARSTDLVREALSSNTDRDEKENTRIAEALQEILIDLPREHGAVFGADDALKAGLPVIRADPKGEQWQIIWRLWAKYFTLNSYVYEGRLASQIAERHPSG
jgi:hypothetical protein